jgi:nitrite reductase (NADH) large subunit
MPTPGQLIVAGNGMVGQRFVEALRERDEAGRWQVTVLAEEPRRAYDRVAMSSYLDGADAASLDLVPPGCYEPGASGPGTSQLRLGEAVTAIDRAGRTVTTSRGACLGYDALVLATGSAPFVPPVPGSALPGCFTYRTLDDLDAIRAWAHGAAGPGAGLVVGGGLLGLEAARALGLLGLAPHVVELAPRLMPQQVDEGGGALLRELIEGQGVTVHLGTSVASVRPGGRRLRGKRAGPLAVTLADGTRLDVRVVVFAAGVRPRDQLARDAGLATGERGGIVIDDGGQTADPAVHAIGDCACLGGRVYGLVAPGYAMAQVLASRLTGGTEVIAGTPDTSTALKLVGVAVASFGDALGGTDGALAVTLNNPVAGSYAKLVVSDDARTLLGGVLVGDAAAYPLLRPLVGRPLPGDPVAMLAAPGATAIGGTAGLPGDAQVCTCHAVTKDAVGAAIAAGGLADVGAVKAATKAGTGCGSCVPLLQTLLAQAGVPVSPALCEHFSQTRAELFELVRADGIGTFTELIQQHGQGRGCDICKPVAASILASLGHGHILDGEQAALQDTNDHFLANIQRNGTYSVVPRIPGGEITPDKLIVLGEVARDFGLYTKITGGQRIDLLGARVEELPAIWKRLVDAGFESGHAYGKAMRTVKSCVGSTWCRYGVQDSVGLAIELELRYRGIRSPHKIKAGVSGCARECAEARAKDIGVIASEQGWTLYVGGNGGFRPRHAQLLASGLATPDLIRVIDRFIMFYVRTADRLQRTATWLETLDGGPEYLRAVLIDDSLGLGAELDAAMAAHVSNYADEWAAVLADPAKLARFVSFVNAPGTPDPSIAFVTERGQRRPAPVPLPMPSLEVVR